MPNKSLGQHWLKDRLILEAIADSIPISKEDTVLEIGPGLGTLTSVLLKRANRVIAVEYDPELARKLPAQFPGKTLEVVNTDFLKFDLRALPTSYKVVANVPYYITQKILEVFLMAEHRPSYLALLVQKEVAEKLAARPGHMTAIAVKVQLYYEVSLGERVPREVFTPPPKVDSQVIILSQKVCDHMAKQELKLLFKCIDIGFSAPRKKLASVMAGGFSLEKDVTKRILIAAGIDEDCRASNLSVEDWKRLSRTL